MSEVDFELPPEDPAPAAIVTVARPEVEQAPENRFLSVVPPMAVARHRNSGNGDLPHSDEAEQSLLASILIDPESVLPKCRDSRITGDSFYVTANRVIYGRILKIEDKGDAVNISSLATDLAESGTIEQVGGFVYLNNLANRASTTLEASRFVDKVREMALRRDLIKCAHSIAEDTKGLNGVAPGEFDQFLESIKGRFQTVTEQRPFTEKNADALAVRIFDAKVKVDKPESLFTLAGTTICTAGNLTAITAQAKSGKSSFVGAILSSAMGNATNGADTLGVGGHNYSKLPLLHFDTEQSRFDWQTLIETSLKRAKIQEAPPWLMSYNLTGLGAPECRDLIEYAIRTAHKKFGGIHSVIIDGIGDLVINPNDEGECFPLITKLHSLAIEFNTAIINVLHLNPASKTSDTKSRGHLGSQLERKSESNLTMEKDAEGITQVWGIRQRGKMIPKSEGPTFKWSDDEQMHVSCEAPKQDAPERKGRPEKYEFSRFRQMFPDDPAKAVYKSVIAKMATDTGINDKTLRNKLQEWTEAGFIIQTQMAMGLKYHMAPAFGKQKA